MTVDRTTQRQAPLQRSDCARDSKLCWFVNVDVDDSCLAYCMGTGGRVVKATEPTQLQQIVVIETRSVDSPTRTMLCRVLCVTIRLQQIVVSFPSTRSAFVNRTYFSMLHSLLQSYFYQRTKRTEVNVYCEISQKKCIAAPMGIHHIFVVFFAMIPSLFQLLSFVFPRLLSLIPFFYFVPQL